jgi:hypothetical protein
MLTSPLPCFATGRGVHRQYDSGRRRIRREQRRAFKDAFITLKRRIELLACLPIDKLSRLALHERLTRIGQQHTTGT